MSASVKPPPSEQQWQEGRFFTPHFIQPISLGIGITKNATFGCCSTDSFGNWPSNFVQVLRAGTGAVFALELLLVIDYCSTVPPPIFEMAIKCD